MTVSAVALTGANQTVRANTDPYRGFVIRETSGTAPALVLVWDNTSAAAGTLLDEISLAAGESAREFYPAPLATTAGIFVQVVSGAVAGSIRVGA